MNDFGLETPPLTWLDVERRLKKATQSYRQLPPCIAAIRCFSDATEIDYLETEDQAKDWLQSVFRQFLNADRASVELGIGRIAHYFEFEKVASVPRAMGTALPLWDQQVYLQDVVQNYPQQWQDGPEVLAFHSFKGGVGRTTALMTFAAAYVNGSKPANPKKMLLIDGDFEAPGISFWIDSKNRPAVSFVQLLEALHYPPQDVDATLDFFAAQLRKTSLEVNAACEVFILPSALDLAEIMDMPVRPEHLAHSINNPWCLSDYLQRLGKLLQADLVMVDLRAGLSELSSPLIFDPRIQHYFVSTVAPQSILGMEQILRRLFAFQSKFPDVDAAKPTVILSLLTDDLCKLPEYNEATEKLNEAFPCADASNLESGLVWLEAYFDSNLMSLRSVKQALELLVRSSLYPAAEKWVAGKTTSTTSPAAAKEGDLAKKLHDTCKAFQFAESANANDLLMTEPLRNLAKHFSQDLPNVVSIGAKGAGKTFTFVQLCRCLNWQAFLQSAGITPTMSQTACIYPVMTSTNLQGQQAQIIEQAKEQCQQVLKLRHLPDQINTAIKPALRANDTEWDGEWEKILLAPFAALGTDFASVNQALLDNNQSLVLIVDGIEDHFDTPDSEQQREAIKALLQIPNRLNSMRDRRIGLVCMVREDFVQLAIRQNLQQYLSRFEAFKLEWTPETFLRLVFWICSKAGVISASSEQASILGIPQLLEALEELWGKKLGKDDSKEANSARWVFSALCDFNGRLQARDIVRFLKFAAQNAQSRPSTTFTNRLLPPDAMRQALEPCSGEKVDEALREIKPLKDWSEKLQQVDASAKLIPFSTEMVNLDNAALRNLQELGIIYENKDQGALAERYYLPEIYRIGMGFIPTQAGRPKILAFLKRSLGNLPF